MALEFIFLSNSLSGKTLSCFIKCVIARPHSHKWIHLRFRGRMNSSWEVKDIS
jgi:hypothetical protein